jgi:pyruvate formate lyase activating enzyme
MSCVKVCSEGAHKDINGKHEFNFSMCQGHFECADECAFGALKIVGRHMEVESIIEEVLKDKAYYDNSNGGITISGGEPMAQFDFTLELLKASKSYGINTCIETCGVAPHRNFEKVISFTDTFLFDYKATGSYSHQSFTGLDNKGILSNLDFLYKNGAKIIVRCPLVKGINDSEEHLWAISSLAEKYPNLIGIEIMPYHNLGNSKSHNIGESPLLTNIDTTDEETKHKWIETLKLYSCNSSLIRLSQ